MSTLTDEATFGPCSPWITGDDVAASCTQAAAAVGTDTAQLDQYAAAASEALWAMCGGQFDGVCEETVRPCKIDCGCWDGWGSDSWPWSGSVGWNWGWNGTSGRWSFGWQQGNNLVCGCSPLSRVHLFGFPVVSIVEVLIDGVALDELYPDGSPQWRLDDRMYLTRMQDPASPDVQARWPSCQNLALPATEEGTWQVTYQRGQAPPEIGVLAAKQLACQMFNSMVGGPCVLPQGATKVTRQGVTLDRTLFLMWAWTKARGWATGLPMVDAFLQATNPAGLRRAPAVWSPDIQQAPLRIRD